MLLSIVVSFKNEAANLLQLTERIHKSMKPLADIAYEIIFVDDQSTDDSAEIIKKLMGKSKGEIVLVTMSRNFGVSECVLAGLEVSRGEIVIYMDADLQDPPELIPDLISKYRETGSEIVHSVRTKRKGESWVKLRITSLGYSYLEKMYKVSIPREAGDYKLLTRRVVNLLLEFKEQLPFMRGLIANLGFKQSYIYYERDARGDGEKNSKFKVFSLRWINSQLDRTLISFSDAPLKLVLFSGISFSILSIFGMVAVLTLKFMGLALPGWTAIMSAILLMGSIQVFMLGVLGLYINVIYLETKKRPVYIIDKVER
jgi:glycosyltransferase involved in cell wall biosynthesis